MEPTIPCSMIVGEEIHIFSSGEHVEILSWVDKVPLSRSKKHINRDFQDGVLMAEIIFHYFPKYVDLHNYVAANSAKTKKMNWMTLNRKVFSKLGMSLCETIIESVIVGRMGSIQTILKATRKRIETIQAEKEAIKAALIEAKDRGDCESQDVCTEVVCQAHGKDVVKYIMYQGLKYIPKFNMEENSKIITDLEVRNRELDLKSRRLETLVNLKDQRLADLTTELHELRVQQSAECTRTRVNSPGTIGKSRLSWNEYI